MGDAASALVAAREELLSTLFRDGLIDAESLSQSLASQPPLPSPSPSPSPSPMPPLELEPPPPLENLSNREARGNREVLEDLREDLEASLELSAGGLSAAGRIEVLGAM